MDDEKVCRVVKSAMESMLRRITDKDPTIVGLHIEIKAEYPDKDIPITIRIARLPMPQPKRRRLYPDNVDAILIAIGIAAASWLFATLFL